MTSERRNWRWMAEFNIHSWFGEHSHWSRVGQRVIREYSPVSVSASNVPSNAGNATLLSNRGDKPDKEAYNTDPASPIDFAVSRKAIVFSNI
jgi:hypothetical protein